MTKDATPLTVNVLFLGPSRDQAGVETACVELHHGATIADLRKALCERFQSLAGAMPAIRFAVNDEFALDRDVLRAGDEVAVIPPVSGGVERPRLLVELTGKAIPADRAAAFVAGDPALGGIVSFHGVTRGEADATLGALDHLEYEAFEPMALKKLEQLGRQALERWSPARIGIVHRTGAVAPAETSVVIAVACGHRAEAFEACRWLIDTLKTEVPIWKKDVLQSGQTRWVEPPEASVRDHEDAAAGGQGGCARSLPRDAGGPRADEA